MESYSQNSNKLDFQHEARILNGIWLITALGLVATAGLAWGAKYLEITATKYDSPQMGNDSNLLIVFYVQIMPDDFVMQLHR
ncbi:BAX inhibitor (BI)-1/YccA family protein, partial [Escherichia coli]|nr:BAX inhibitor (BI)-1/YccA family protein [Escherichia coli]